MVGLVSPFILLLFPVAMRKIGGVGFLRIGLIVAALAGALRFFMPYNLPVILITVALSGFGINAIMMMNHYFILQTIDYGEYKSGTRIEGTPSAFCNFMNNVGSAFGSFVVGAIMAVGGYVGTATLQTDSAIASIRSLYSLVPAVICILMLVLLHFYDVEKILPKMREEYESKKVKPSN